MLAPARKGSDTDETAFVDTGAAADGGEGGVAGPGDASLRTRAVLQHVFWRASAGASHQAGRPGDHQDHRCRRHGLERQERGVRAQPADRALLCGRGRARRHAGGVDREDRGQSRRRLCRQPAGAVRAGSGGDRPACGPRSAPRHVEARQGPRCGHPLGTGHHAGPGAAAAADARLRRCGARAQGSHRHEHAGRPSAATWTTPAWSPA